MSKRLRALTFAALAFGGCQQVGDLPMPNADDVVGYYTYDGRLTAEISGNVATLSVAQDPQLLRRGGTLWAKVGPYVFIFSDETRQLLDDYPGLAGVRVTTTVGRAQVATALLARSELSDVLWRRSLNIAGKARRDGTQRVTLLQDLVRWGEDHTEYEYNPTYTSRRP